MYYIIRESSAMIELRVRYKHCPEIYLVFDGITVL